jgi:hypothetical protein
MQSRGKNSSFLMPLATLESAKFSKGVINRIIDHALAEGWLAPGQTVCDCFAGVALGALPCLLRGVHWAGCELEPRFVALGNANLALWQRRYGHLDGYGQARLVQADSRRLGEVLAAGAVEAVLSSPPYADRCANDNQRTLARDGLRQGHNEGDGATYGQTPGQLSAMPMTDLAISSPPYADGCVHDTRQNPSTVRTGAGTLKYPWGTRKGGDALTGYGDTAGQLGTMAPGDVQAVVSSPPYEASLSHTGTINRALFADAHQRTHLEPHGQYSHAGEKDAGKYGTDPKQLGNTHGDTFWSAARTILEQTYAVLKPGGYAIWIVKDYVREGKIVPFSHQWRALCEHVGFVTLHEHHALLVESHAEMGLFGEPVTMYRVAKKGFFRRLHERKRPDLAIDYETIWCMRKKGLNE